MEISNFLEHDEQNTPNIRQIKALYRALSEKDTKAIGKLLVDEPIWNVSPGFPDGGVYLGMSEVSRNFYTKIRNRYRMFGALPETFIDGGDVVTVLGFYKVEKSEEDSFKLVRFAHTWKFDIDGRIKGVWQVADSAQLITAGID